MKDTRSEHEIFADLEAVCSSPGYIHVLAYFSWRDNYVGYSSAMTADDLAKTYAPSRLIRTELSTLVGLLIKTPLDFQLPSPLTFQSLVQRTEAYLEELHHALNAPMMASFTQEKIAAKINPFEQADVLREPIFYGGESAYSFQYRDFARQRYSSDNDWLTSHKGFNIDEAHAVVLAISRLQDARMAATMKAMRKAHPATWTLLPGHTFTRDDVASEVSLSKATLDAVLRAFSLAPSPINLDFKSLGDFNLANATPLIRTPDDTFVSLQTYALVEALYDAPYYWMAADAEYRPTASKHRGQFTEEFTAQRFKAVFGQGHVHPNVIVSGSKGRSLGEIDILVSFGDRLVIVQCKSKKLTLKARKGNDLRLKSDFKRAVQDAYDQGLACAKAISAKSGRLIAADGAEIQLSELREIYILTVVSDHYPALAVQGQQFLKYETNSTIQPPLVTDIFFVDVLAEMLSTPLRFLSYVNRRVNYIDRVSSINEFTILGYHLKRNLWFDEEELDFVMIAEEFAIDLDLAMTVRREGIPGEGTPSGILTRNQNTTVSRLIRGIEQAPDAALVDLGFLLLDLSEETLRDLSNGIDQITRKTRSDGRKHDITFGFDKPKGGITLHCSREPNPDASLTLLSHCERRKYAQKANSWFGLAVREDDGIPKFGVNLRHPWKPDARMDELTQGMIRGGNATFVGGLMKRTKVGRNDPCPCGSGKKYKKCHLN